MYNKSTISQRRYDLDWLRVLAILTVFIFHSSHFFDTSDWSVKNAIHYPGVDIFMAILSSWMMPLIFIISGASLYYAMAKGGYGKFARDKVLRLLVPLLVGIFTHVILQVYLERLSHGQFSGSFWEFLPHYFDGMYGFGGNFAWMGLHLWYLLMLFIYSLLLYPLFRWLRGGGSAVLNATGEFLARPGAVYLLALPIMLLISILNPSDIFGRRDFGGWSMVPYLLFFVYGFILIASTRMQQAIQNQRWISLAGAIVTMLAARVLRGDADPHYGTLNFVLLFSVYALMGWFWMVAILGFGMRHLTKTNPFLQYANEAVLPFYVMHQTVLLAVGYLVVQMPIPDLLKWGIIAAVSFGIITGLYELLVRRVNLLRFLFGMKLLGMHSEPQPASRPARMAGSH